MSSVRELAPQASQASPSGDGILAGTGMWSFSGAVPQSFDQHVRKSVPLYHQGHELIARMSEYFVGPGSLSYEVGCSTGTVLRMLAEKHQGKGASFVGIDIEEDMTDFAKDCAKGVEGLNFQCADAVTYEYEKCDFVVAYYTVQFVRPKYRQALIDRLYAALNWGGALVMFEKVRAPDARFQDIATQMYADYKSDAGFSPDEILNKSRSLKRVLEPFSTKANMDMLERAGFKDVMSVLKYVSFEGFLGIK